MEMPELTLKLELLGHLVEQLNYWSNQFPEDDIDIVEEEFDSTIETIRRLKNEILEDLDGYFENIKINNEPIYLPYYTIRKELRETNF